MTTGGDAPSMNFEFATAGKIVFGPGTLKQVGGLAKGFGTRALLVTGSNPTRAQRLISLLEADHVHSVVFPTRGEPEIQVVEEGTALAHNEHCELVISFGGGSAVDAGKAISAMLTNPGELLDYLEVIGKGEALSAPAAPFIAIPTTAGTGSEVTRNAVLGAPKYQTKVSLRSPLMLPRVAVVDPELTYGLPPALTASTGMDALTQLIEPYVSARANLLVDALCQAGIRRAGSSLLRAYRDGSDTAARQDMSLASLLGGLALANAGLGAVHGFAGPIGGMFPIAPHGAVCAALLPHVMDVNIHALQARQPAGQTLSRFQQVAAWLIGQPGATPEHGVEWVRRLVSDLHIPGLSSYGLTKTPTGEVVEKAMKASSMKANPLLLTSQELAAVFEAAL